MPTPDLILLDLNMPRMDGHQFLAEVKADPDLATIPIVVVTTSDEDADIVESYRLHANAYVTKPIGLEQMGKVVRAIEGFWFEVVRLPNGTSGGLIGRWMRSGCCWSRTTLLTRGCSRRGLPSGGPVATTSTT